MARTWRLDTLPGLNGDEAWAGVQVEQFLQGGDVEYVTPTGNPLNPLFFVPLLIVEAWRGPTVETLRSISLISGLLVLPVNYFLAKRSAGATVAIVTTVILAILPVNIAYSRFAWDTCQSVLITLPVVYAPLLAVQEPARCRRWWSVALAAWLVALLVHPTNIFTAPLLILPAMWQGRYRLRQWWSTAWGQACAVALALIGCLALYKVWLQYASERSVAGDLILSTSRTIDLLSGVTVLRFIPGLETAWGSGGQAFAVGLTILLVVLFALSLWGWCIGIERPRWVLVAAVSTLVMWLGFHLVAGPQALVPHFERYGLCLIAPLVLLVGWGLGQLIEQRPAVGGVLVALAVAWLFTACGLYYGSFLRTAGSSHHAFYTGSAEPKAALLEAIRNRAEHEQTVQIITDQWWSYWPLRYLAARDPWLQVLEGKQVAPLSGPYWDVKFVLPDEASTSPRMDHAVTAYGYARRPVLRATYHDGDASPGP